MKFSEFLEEQLLKFNGKTNQPFGQIVIMAGGSGSGKSTIMQQMVGFQGKIFDTDAIKKIIKKSESLQELLIKTYGDKLNFDVKNINLGDPKTVEALHLFVKSIQLDKRPQNAFYNEKKTLDGIRLPNLFIDTTLDNPNKIMPEINQALAVGYLPENIHIVWVLNSLENMLINNSFRDRKVPNEIVTQKATDVAKSIKSILSNSEFQSKINGDWYVVFNEAKQLGFEQDPENENKQRPVFKLNILNPAKGYRKIVADYALLKKSGQKPNFTELAQDIKDRILKLIPKGSWD